MIIGGDARGPMQDPIGRLVSYHSQGLADRIGQEGKQLQLPVNDTVATQGDIVSTPKQINMTDTHCHCGRSPLHFCNRYH